VSEKAAQDGTVEASGKAGTRRGGKLTLVLIAAGMLVVGGGGVAALMMSGMIGGHASSREDNQPKLVRKGEDDPYMPKAEGEEGAAPPEVEGDGGDPYRTAYFTFSEDFTSNLKDSDALVQLSLACSTRRDGRVVIWLKKHELAIRSALLEILADTPENDVYTMPGKDRLEKRLTAAINNVLIRKEGFGGVDGVYFRTFIIQ
jgi:flagellar FliL protein